MRTNKRLEVLNFVVLKHEVGPGLRRDQNLGIGSPVHFDWMLESDGTLLTWSTEPLLSILNEVDEPANQLPNHRLEYLEIEGDIGGNRGTVSQVARGEMKWIEKSDQQFVANLNWEHDGESINRELLIYRILDRNDFSLDGFEWRLRLGVCR